MPEITPDLVDRLCIDVYRQRLVSDGDRQTFDALPEAKRQGRARCYAGIIRATLRALGYVEPAKGNAPADDFRE